MNCIVIDDDNVSRILMEKYISKTDFLQLKASFSSAVEAISTIKKDDDIDLIFLDIEMPEMTGIELIKSFETFPNVIIISAKEKYAIEAIEYDVADYLLKPVSYARFIKAVNKISVKSKNTDDTSISVDGIFIRGTGSSLMKIKYDDILWIEALENYVVINTFDDKHTIHFTMKSLLSKLPVKKFIRVHRSFIVNLRKIDIIDDNAVIMKNKTGDKAIPIAKSYKAELLDTLNVINK